jgi:hypothetical protein
MRVLLLMFVTAIALALTAGAEENSSSQQAPEGNTVCTFGDGQQLSIRYPQVPYSKAELPNGKVWTPGKQPIYLFSQTNFEFGSAKVQPGAYSLYVIPGEQTWTLVLNRGVQKNSPYDPHQDIGKLQAQTGKLSNASQTLSLYFGRIAPDKCTLRIDYGKERAFADFKQN